MNSVTGFKFFKLIDIHLDCQLSSQLELESLKAFHSKFGEGIISYLSNVPKKRILTVCTIFRSEMEEKGGKLEGIADFIWVLDE